MSSLPDPRKKRWKPEEKENTFFGKRKHFFFFHSRLSTVSSSSTSPHQTHSIGRFPLLSPVRPNGTVCVCLFCVCSPFFSFNIQQMDPDPLVSELKSKFVSTTRRVEFSQVTRTGPISEEVFPSHMLHTPTVVLGTRHLWDVESAVSIERLQTEFSHLECVLVDLSLSPAEIDRQRNELRTVKDYFENCQSSPLLYMTEIYMRGVCPVAATRPYPWCVFGPAAAAAGTVQDESHHDENWFHTDIPGRLESFFLGNRGTFGIIHHDKIFGVGFLYMLSGVKRVVFFPPEAEPALAQAFPPSFRQKHFGLELTQEDLEGIRRCGGQVAIVRAGELLVIPHGWWHQITNLEDQSFSYVDMVVTKDHLLNLCSTTDPDRFSLQHTLREIIPYRLRLAEDLLHRLPEKRKRLSEHRPQRQEVAAGGKEKAWLYGTGPQDALSREWDLLHGLMELHRGLSATISNLTLEEEREEFRTYQDHVSEYIIQLQKALF